MIAYEEDRTAAAKFTEEQIVLARRQADTGTVVAEVCRKMGINEAIFYNRTGGPVEKEVWMPRYSQTSSASPVRSGHRMEENQQLKQLVADLSPDNRCFKT